MGSWKSWWMLVGIWCAKVIFGFTQIYGLTYSGFEIDRFFLEWIKIFSTLAGLSWLLRQLLLQYVISGVKKIFCLQKIWRFQEVGDSQKWLHPHPAQNWSCSTYWWGALHSLTGQHTDKKKVKDSCMLMGYVLGLVTRQQPWCDERVVSR